MSSDSTLFDLSDLPIPILSIVTSFLSHRDLNSLLDLKNSKLHYKLLHGGITHLKLTYPNFNILRQYILKLDIENSQFIELVKRELLRTGIPQNLTHLSLCEDFLDSQNMNMLSIDIPENNSIRKLEIKGNINLHYARGFDWFVSKVTTEYFVSKFSSLEDLSLEMTNSYLVDWSQFKKLRSLSIRGGELSFYSVNFPPNITRLCYEPQYLGHIDMSPLLLCSQLLRFESVVSLYNPINYFPTSITILKLNITDGRDGSILDLTNLTNLKKVSLSQTQNSNRTFSVILSKVELEFLETLYLSCNWHGCTNTIKTNKTTMSNELLNSYFYKCHTLCFSLDDFQVSIISSNISQLPDLQSVILWGSKDKLFTLQSQWEQMKNVNNSNSNEYIKWYFSEIPINIDNHDTRNFIELINDFNFYISNISAQNIKLFKEIESNLSSYSCLTSLIISEISVLNLKKILSLLPSSLQELRYSTVTTFGATKKNCESLLIPSDISLPNLTCVTINSKVLICNLPQSVTKLCFENFGLFQTLNNLKFMSDECMNSNYPFHTYNSLKRLECLSFDTSILNNGFNFTSLFINIECVKLVAVKFEDLNIIHSWWPNIDIQCRHVVQVPLEHIYSLLEKYGPPNLHRVINTSLEVYAPLFASSYQFAKWTTSEFESKHTARNSSLFEKSFSSYFKDIFLDFGHITRKSKFELNTQIVNPELQRLKLKIFNDSSVYFGNTFSWPTSLQSLYFASSVYSLELLPNLPQTLTQLTCSIISSDTFKFIERLHSLKYLELMSEIYESNYNHILQIVASIKSIETLILSVPIHIDYVVVKEIVKDRIQSCVVLYENIEEDSENDDLYLEQIKDSDFYKNAHLFATWLFTLDKSMPNLKHLDISNSFPIEVHHVNLIPTHLEILTINFLFNEYPTSISQELVTLELLSVSPINSIHIKGNSTWAWNPLQYILNLIKKHGIQEYKKQFPPVDKWRIFTHA